MTILLADDERLVRLGLQSMLEELAPERHHYFHAGNGYELVEIVKTKCPDIVFLDVKMPLMNGLEALRQCREFSPSTVYIILSGYADFEFAREAISLSAFDYILKPIDIDTLKRIMTEITASREASRRQNNSVFCHNIIQSFDMADQFGESEIEFMPDNSSDYILYQFYIDMPEQESQSHIKQKLWSNLTEFCEQNASIVNYCLFFNTSGNLCLVCDMPDASRLTHFISLQSEGLSPNAFSVFWGNQKTIRKIYEVSCQITKIANIRLLKNCSAPSFIRNIEVLPSLSILLSFAGAIISLSDLYLNQNQGTYRHKLQKMRDNTVFRHIFPLIELSVLQNYLNGIFGRECRFKTYDDMIDFLTSLEFKQNPSGLSGYSANITQIKDYIYKNYAEDISISHVSELFSLSPTYLSRIFHEKTGQKYIDFITQVRMEAAIKTLRANPGISVKQTAGAVGYASVRHFSKTFQKYTGVLPSEYHSE